MAGQAGKVKGQGVSPGIFYTYANLQSSDGLG